VEAAAEITEIRTGKRQVPYVTYSGAASAIRQITFRSSPSKLNSVTPAMAQIGLDRRAMESATDMTQNASKVEDPSASSSERNKPEMTWQNIEEGNFNGWKTESINGYDYVPLLDLGNFYRFRRMGVSGKVHALETYNMVVEFATGTKKIRINQINFSTSLPILEKQKMAYLSRLDLDKLVDPVLRPNYIQGKTYFDRVIIDPSGCGDGESALYNELTFKMALALKEQLNTRGFRVVLTRQEGEDVSLAKRIQIANSLTPAVYIRLTYQESSDSTKRGIESLALTPLGAISDYDEAIEDMKCAGNKWDACNVGFATAVHAMVISRFDLVDLGLRRSRHPVLTGLNCPAVIFRGGYLSNQNESKLIHSPVYVESLSSAIADAISNFRIAISGTDHNLNKPGNNSKAVADQESVLFIVQRVLSFTGLYDGKIDGVMGKGTRQALINYQKSQGLEASGELSDETLSQLGLKK
jgi:N-acetylmuramoyl-L-alanine amidase